MDPPSLFGSGPDYAISRADSGLRPGGNPSRAGRKRRSVLPPGICAAGIVALSQHRALRWSGEPRRLDRPGSPGPSKQCCVMGSRITWTGRDAIRDADGLTVATDRHGEPSGDANLLAVPLALRLDDDFDSSVVGAALRRLIVRYWTVETEAFCRHAVGRDAA